MNLSKVEIVGRIPSTGNPLPFPREPDAHIEATFARVGEPPLRIYKNEYDKQPTCYTPARPSCTEGHGQLVSFDEESGIVRVDGQDKLELHHQREISALESPEEPPSNFPSWEDAIDWICDAGPEIALGD